MLKISELGLRKLLVSIVKDTTLKSGKKISGLIKEFNKKSFEELEEINEKRENDKKYNQYYYMLDGNYIVFDTDDEEVYNKLKRYLERHNLYNKNAITQSFKNRTQNLYFKCHFWFKINDKHEFRDLGNGQIKFCSNLDVIFNSGGFIGEFKDAQISDKIPIMTRKIYNELHDILNENDNMIDINEMQFTDDENDENDEKDEKDKKPKIKKQKNEINNEQIKEEELILILDSLHEKRYNDYNCWLHIYFVFINENLPLSIFDNFSKKCKYYNKEENDKILKNIKIVNTGFTIATLYFYLKEDNKEIFNKLCKNQICFWFSDLSNYTISKMYFNLYPDEYIYNTSLGWFEYNKYNVLISRGEEAINLYKNFSERLIKLGDIYKNTITPDDEQKKEKKDFIKKFCCKVGQTTFKQQCMQELKCFYSDDELQKKLYKKSLLAFNNCLYDNEINEYRLINKDDYITITTDYELTYNINKLGKIEPLLNADMKRKIKDIIKSIFENKEIEKFWFYSTASCLFGNILERYYIHTGIGSNGKGLTQQIIKNCFGGYYIQVSNNFLMGSIKQGGADAETAQTVGIRYISINEPDDSKGEKFNTNKIKEYSGNGEISTRPLYGKPFTFIPQFTMNISTNDIPKSEKADHALRRRLNIINYPFQFKDGKYIVNKAIEKPIDYDLKDKYIYDHEFIQTTMIYLLSKVYKSKTKKFETPKQITNKVNKYCDENNDLYDWFNENLQITNNENDIIRACDLLNNYNYSEHCIKKLRPVDFKKLMEKFPNIKKKETSKGNFYLGLIFNENNEDK